MKALTRGIQRKAQLTTMSELGSMELPKTMLIIKSSATALTAVETFLRNRGWKIYSTPNLRDALVQLTTNKPAYVLVSVDHPNKKVRALPKVLMQAFPVATISFAENQNSLSYKLLNESATEYRVYPPMTGPAIERCVNKYLKDLETKEKLKSANNDFNAEKLEADQTGVISAKGNRGGNIEVRGGERGGYGSVDASNLLSQFFADDIGSVSGPSELSAKQEPNLVFAQPIEENDGTGMSYMPGAQDPGSLTGSEASKNGVGQTYVQKGSNGHVGNYHDHQKRSDLLEGTQGSANGKAMSGAQGSDTNGSANAGYNPGSLDDADGSMQANSAGAAAARQNDISGKPSDPDSIPMGSREFRRSQNQGPGWAAQEVDPKAGAEIRIRGNPRPKLKDDSLLVRGSLNALTESVEVRDCFVHQKVEDSTNMACIVVESPRFSGYLVAVMGKDQKIDSGFIQIIQKRLFKFLSDNGEKAADGRDTMGLKIKQVDFEPWATEYADFLRKSVHQGNEVAMAFFPRNQMDVVLEESKHQDMAKINLKDLKGDGAVEFDLYVFLPNNNKYVLYTPKGGVFYNKQLDRLKQQGITHMHVQKDAVADISKYQAQNYLNEMVDDYGKDQSTKLNPKAS